MGTKTIVSLRNKTMWMETGKEEKLIFYSIPSYTSLNFVLCT